MNFVYTQFRKRILQNFILRPDYYFIKIDFLTKNKRCCGGCTAYKELISYFDLKIAFLLYLSYKTYPMILSL